MAKLYEYAVIYQPAKKKDEEKAERGKMIVDVTRTLAENDQEVSIMASRAIPDEYINKLDEVQIVVRPF